NDTTVASQALFMLNSPFVREQAGCLARLLLADAGRSPQDRLQQAYLRTLGRPPTAEEVRDALDFLERYAARAAGLPGAGGQTAAWQSYCQMLFCSNEFLYVD